LSKLRRKDLLKKQDEFLIKSWNFLDWARANARRVLWGGIGAAAVLLAVLLAMGYSKSQEQAAAQALGQAYSLYRAALPAGPASPLAAQAESALLKVGQDYSGTLNASQAKLFLAHLLMLRQAYEQALPLLEELGAESGLPAPLAAMSQGEKGQCLEELGRLEEAEKAYARAAGLSGENSSALWRMAQARALAGQGKNEPAKVLYEQVIASTLSPLLQNSAAQALVGMGVNPPLPSLSWPREP
jgi:tetratricopeptide (TPR) repeat protein